MQAIDRALEVARQPKQLMRQVPLQLPPDMIEVIKCAAGDEPTLIKHAEARNLSQQKLRDAARVYLQHVITHANGNDRLVLGLPQSAGAGEVREHKRWMLKWLHPDRNPSKWETNLFQRVKEASDRLENGTAHEAQQPKIGDVFKRKRTSPPHKTRLTEKSAAAGLHRTRLRKRDVLRLMLVPMLLAACVAAALSFAWLRFGPRGGY